MNYPPPTKENICSALSFISPDLERNEWVKIATAIKTECPDGFYIFDEWSQQGSRYEKSATKDTWNSVQPGSVAINTVFFFALQNGWQNTDLIPETSEQKIKRDKERADKIKIAAQLKKANAEAATNKTIKLVSLAVPAPSTHPYLLKKGVQPGALLQIPTDQAARLLGYHPQSNEKPLVGQLLIATVQINGLISTAELIDENGKKTAIAGGVKSGGFWSAQPLPEHDHHELTFVIAEGVATALSAREATGYYSVAALSASNLLKTAQALRKQYPTARRIILADVGNGQKEASQAALASQSTSITPVFTLIQIEQFISLHGKTPTDFNDLHLIAGLSAVTAQLIPVSLNETPPTFDDSMPAEIIQWKQDLINHVKLFNENHAQVIIGGQHRIMRTVPKEANIFNHLTYEFLPQSTLSRIYQNTLIKTGEKILRSGDCREYYDDLITGWAKHPFSRAYRKGIVFKPNNKPIDGYFNTWLGYAVKPKQQSELWNEIKVHIEYIICNKNPELIKYFYDWCAYTFQNPDKPAGTAIVCRGEKGSGKGTIGNFLMNIWANHSFHISSAKHLTGNFNSHLANVCFLFADEAFFSGDKTHEGVLKALITEPFLSVEMKGVDVIQQQNYLKIFMATNAEWAVPATKDERRYAIYDVADTAIGDVDYFKGLRKDIANPDVQAAFLYDMLNRDISTFSSGQIPESQGLKDQRLHSLPNHGKWLIDCFDKGSFDNSDQWQEEVNSQEIWISYVAWCDTQKISEYGRITQTTLGRYLAQIGFIKRKTVGVIKWKFGTLAEATAKFEQYEKITLTLE